MATANASLRALRLHERKWGRVWECDQLLNLVDAFEKSVRVPGP
jgi:hypothetical protein